MIYHVVFRDNESLHLLHFFFNSRKIDSLLENCSLNLISVIVFERSMSICLEGTNQQTWLHNIDQIVTWEILSILPHSHHYALFSMQNYLLNAFLLCNNLLSFELLFLIFLKF